MDLALALGLGMARGPAAPPEEPPAPLPRLLGYAHSNAGNPAVPTHVAGNLLVALGMINGSVTPPTLADSWVLRGTAAGNSCAMAVYTKVATGAAHTIAWTGSSSTRAVWVLDGVFDTIAFAAPATGTTCTWPALASMAADSIVIGCVFSRATQTAIGTAVGLANATNAAALGVPPFTQRVDFDSSAPSRWLGDTGAASPSQAAVEGQDTVIDAFPGGTRTFPATSTGHLAVAVSIKGPA